MTYVQVPEFISFLFSNKPKFDVYFVVGNKNVSEPERIGGVKMMLMAHSEVLRCELEDSEIAEKQDVKVEDIHPDIFKSMLKYVYGYDTTAELSFDDADNMLYAAEKYMMRRLKDKLATRLMCLLTPDNICSLLNNPACYTHLELDSAITKILQYETGRVLRCPQFLSLCPDGFLKIVQQEGLAVREIEVWKAAVKWAKHRAGDEDGTALRKEISAVEKHIRVCSLNSDDFCTDVITTNILSKEELTLVWRSIGKKEKEDSLTAFCNEIEPRKMLFKNEPKVLWFIDSKNPSQFEPRKTLYQNSLKPLYFTSFENPYQYKHPYFFFDIITKTNPINLNAFACAAKDHKRTEPDDWMYKVDCRVTIKKVANPQIYDYNSEANQEYHPMVVTSTKLVTFGSNFCLPLAIDGKVVTLSPNSKYTIQILSTGATIGYFVDAMKNIVENDDLLLDLKGSRSPVRGLYYVVVKES